MKISRQARMREFVSIAAIVLFAGYGYESIYRIIQLQFAAQGELRASAASSVPARPPDGYHITGLSGVMVFVAVDAARKDHEDTYRLAVADACARRPICQVQFWVGNAPGGLPLTDAQVNSKIVHWQQNLDTPFRHWLVTCSATTLFANERECI